MATNPQSAARSRKIFLALILVIVGIVAVFAYYQNKPWRVPEEAKRRQNPVSTSPSALAAARTIYLDKCVQCHGDTGKGNGPDAGMYYPSPTDLTDARHVNSVTDGELFYQISEGRKPMPAFKKRLAEQQRWHLVLYVRSLAAPGPAAR